MSKLIDLTGQKFGQWEVLERAESTPSGRTRWLCKCTYCNKTIKPVDGCHLRSGRSTNCGCLRTEKTQLATMKDETGKTYGKLKVERIATEEEKPRKDRTGLYYNCTCLNCGRKNVIVFGDYLRNGDTTSCGCIVSKNESIISQYLDELKLKYISQYSFSDLRNPNKQTTNNYLYFDFGIVNDNDELQYLIEYDGIQHFSEKQSWFHGEAQKDSHERDLFKNQYCFSHNIPLIRIPYDVEYTKQDLLLNTTRFLLTSNNEKQYYKRFN